MPTIRLIFKKLIYEMRFDEVSAVYALFGTFYVGVRCPAAGLEELFNGKLPDEENCRIADKPRISRNAEFRSIALKFILVDADVLIAVVRSH